MTCAIKDTVSAWYYTGRGSHYGYYHPDLGRARLYTTVKHAQQQCDQNGHHIKYPGGRTLEIVNIKIEEIP